MECDTRIGKGIVGISAWWGGTTEKLLRGDKKGAWGKKKTKKKKNPEKRGKQKGTGPKLLGSVVGLKKGRRWTR